MMIAVVLSSNVKKMLRDNVLVRKQTGIEAAGSMNILFTDKTGTLTRGKMSVESIILSNGASYRSLNDLKRISPDIFNSFCENAIYNSSAKISGKRVIGGNATERALAESCKRAFIPDYSKVSNKTPFDSNIKYSSATVGSKIYFFAVPSQRSRNAVGNLLASEESPAR